jgi:polysaccharide export outer membrane protein
VTHVKVDLDSPTVIHAPGTGAQLATDLIRYIFRWPWVLIAAMLVSGCSLGPGLQIENIQVDQTLSDEDVLGGKINVIAINADLVRSLRDKQLANLQDRRKQANELFHENQKLKDSYEYRVGHTDILNVVTWGHAELNILSMSARQGTILGSTASIIGQLGGLDAELPATSTAHEVDLDGNIFYPMIQSTNIANKTIVEIRAQITEQLSRYIPAPQIDVTMSQFRSQRAYVVGEVLNPRSVPITQVPMEIIDIVTLAGGLNSQADTRSVTLRREGQNYHIDLQAILDGDLTQNYVLQDQDVLVVPDNRYNSVFMLGEFDKSVQVVIPLNQFFSLADAIYDGSVGGFSKEANPSQIFVFRYNETQGQGDDTLYPEAFHLDASSAEAMLLAANFPLLPRDIIYTAPTGLTRWNRVIAQLLPTIQGVYEVARTYWYIDDVRNRN